MSSRTPAPGARTPAAAAHSPVPPSRQEDAQISFKKGELALRRREYVEAEGHFGRAHQLDPKGTYLAAQAWALYMDPARRAEAARAKSLIQKALELDPNCDRAHYQLGVIARVEGDLLAAERHFKAATRANPRHLEASQELRLIDLRRRKGQLR